MAAICSLIREFNWDIETVIDLNWTQIETLNKGLGELHRLTTPDSMKSVEELQNDSEYQQKLGDSLRSLVNKETGQVDIMKI